ncbi:MAG: hypothetical protein KAG62_10715 [Caulobacter sp.]|jgi:predicted flap endonuclease-1-like 5' DNA nuclease|uniref:phasin PhaH n=1 Tax=Caulobacter sp. CCH9-E1 TaxID=1768768 RepID=UPI0008364A51|nr:phasin PhaH [Caulobacter sp. CCH9-E1]MCK5910409.1 hypothetical protein [Caulobacter sp.]
MVSSSFFPEFQADKIEPELAPRLAVGAASPLWLMFGGAAAAGAAYWWWASRWREAVNLEAVLALAPEPVAPAVEAEAVLASTPEPIAEAMAEAVEAVEVVMDAAEEAVETFAEATLTAAEPANDAALEAVEEVVDVVELGPDPEDDEDDEEEDDEAYYEDALMVAKPLTEEVPAELDAVAETVVAAGDDLTRLVGVGPKLAASLAELGVTTFSQIAAWTPEELADIDLKLGLKGRAERDAWIAQAKRFAAGVETATA